ncbi:MFS transporter [Acidilobus sp.]|jgi:MFS family permease|uniref:MFS transporter n=1 Tax=Acidilobus sp. TaxID=1872109 RepID=UPI003D01C785
MKEPTRSLAYLSVLRSLRSVAAGILFIVFPYMVRELLHGSLFELGIMYAVAGLATAGLSIVVGYMSDLIGRKASLYISSALLVLTPIVMLVKFNLAAAFAAAILGGISATGTMGAGGVGGVVGPVQNAIIADLTHRGNRTKLISLLSFIGSVTAAAGTLIGGMFNYREELLLATVISAASMLLIPPLKLPDVRARGLSMKSKVNAFKFSVTGMLNGLASGLTAPFIVPIFIYVYDAPRYLTGEVTTAASLIATFSMLLAPKLEDSLGFLRSIYITRGLTIPIMLAFPLVGNFWAAVGLYLVYPMLRVIAIPVQQSFLLELTPPEERGRVSGYNQGSRLLLSSVGTFIGSPFFYLQDASLLGLMPLYAVPFLAYAVAMGANIYLYRRFFGADEARLRRSSVGVEA